MKEYKRLLKNVYENGREKDGRNGKTRYLLGQTFTHNMKDGFPLLTTKKMYFDRIKSELLWFISGSTSLKDLKKLDPDNKIWDANIEDFLKKYEESWNEHFEEDDSVNNFLSNLETKMQIQEKMNYYYDVGFGGHLYGYQWRTYNAESDLAVQTLGVDGWHFTIDQIALAIDQIKENPESRRIIVNAWNPTDVYYETSALPPCHVLHQYHVDGDYLSLTMYQRSADLFLGVPFNIASYALLLKMVANITGKIPDQLIIHFGDLHIYESHYDQVEKQLEREPKKLPEVEFVEGISDIDEYTMDSIILKGYESDDYIKADMVL